MILFVIICGQTITHKKLWITDLSIWVLPASGELLKSHSQCKTLQQLQGGHWDSRPLPSHHDSSRCPGLALAPSLKGWSDCHCQLLVGPPLRPLMFKVALSLWLRPGQWPGSSWLPSTLRCHNLNYRWHRLGDWLARAAGAWVTSWRRLELRLIFPLPGMATTGPATRMIAPPPSPSRGSEAEFQTSSVLGRARRAAAGRALRCQLLAPSRAGTDWPWLPRDQWFGRAAAHQRSRPQASGTGGRFWPL